MIHLRSSNRINTAGNSVSLSQLIKLKRSERVTNTESVTQLLKFSHPLCVRTYYIMNYDARGRDAKRVHDTNVPHTHCSPTVATTRRSNAVWTPFIHVAHWISIMEWMACPRCMQSLSSPLMPEYAFNHAYVTYACMNAVLISCQRYASTPSCVCTITVWHAAVC